MKKLMHLFLVTVMSTMLVVTVAAQKKIVDGYVTYEVTDIKTEMPGAEMLKGSMMTVAFAAGNSKLEMSMMGGLVRVQTIMDKSNDATLLMDMMGQKIELETSKEEAMKSQPKIGDADISYDKGDKKTIAGYKCYKAMVKPQNGVSMDFYVTKKIKPTESYFNEIFTGLEGFPMQYIINANGIEMVLTAKEVSGEVAAATFEVPSGYQKMTMEEFQKQMGGMNLGF